MGKSSAAGTSQRLKIRLLCNFTNIDLTKNPNYNDTDIFLIRQNVFMRQGEYAIKARKQDIFVIGFALFSMFFGAGNVIFPPYLGLVSGPEWTLGFVCYYIADIGLALAALFALLDRGGA